MEFNGIKKDYVTVLRDRVRPAWTNRGEKKVVVVPVKISHVGFTDLQRKKEDMAKWLIHDEGKFLEFKDEPDRLYLAEIESEMRLEEFPYWAEGEIDFVCKEKYSLERKITINTTETEDILGHKSTQWKTKTTFASDQVGYDFKFNAPGKTELRDINKIKLNYSFKKNDVLEIDYSKRRVLVNGKDVTNTLVIIQSNFMELPIGQVEFESSNDTEVFYHERYY